MNIRDVARDYGLKLVFVTENNIDGLAKKYDVERDVLLKNAVVLDDADILLGIFDDQEIRRAVFFHEIGHTLVTQYYQRLVHDDTMFIEYQAWIEAFKIAKKYHYVFTKKVFKYVLRAIQSYYKDALHAYNV